MCDVVHAKQPNNHTDHAFISGFVVQKATGELMQLQKYFDELVFYFILAIVFLGAALFC